jgi:Ferritin-like domain
MTQDAAAAAAYSRRRLLAKGVVAAALGVGLDAVAGSAAPAASRGRDANILNFLLRLERIQAAFFARAAKTTNLSAELRQYADVVAKHDEAHADALRSFLGADAERSRFRLRPAAPAAHRFMQAAVTLKEAVVAAYIAEGANLSVDRLTPVASIFSVEARHAAWIRSIGGQLPAPRAADEARDPNDVQRTLERSGIASSG